MILDCVLTAVNENKTYLDLCTIFIKTWNKLYPDVDVKIILIAKSIPTNLLLYKDNIILFEPIQNVPTCFTSQFIRLLYPCILNYKNGVMITDVDDLPMSTTFYTKNIEDIQNDKWVNLRDWRTPPHSETPQIAMCWQVATPNTWKDVFHIENLQDIKRTITSYKRISWFSDQLFLYKNVMEWNKKTNRYVFLKDKETGFERLDRSHRWDVDDIHVKKNISEGKYSDYHCYRPMSQYYDKNWKVYELLPKAEHISPRPAERRV